MKHFTGTLEKGALQFGVQYGDLLATIIDQFLSSECFDKPNWDAGGSILGIFLWMQRNRYASFDQLQS